MNNSIYGEVRTKINDVSTTEGDENLRLDLESLRRELAGSLAVIEKLNEDLRSVLAVLGEDPENLIEPVMAGVTDIEASANYAARLVALYAHRELGVSLARLAKGITPSAIRRRIMNDEVEGVERPERFELERDADAGPSLARYEILAREAGLHPWPAPAPLPSKRVRQLHKNRNYRPETRELYRSEFYRQFLVDHPEAKVLHPFGREGTEEPPVQVSKRDSQPSPTV